MKFTSIDDAIISLLCDAKMDYATPSAAKRVEQALLYIGCKKISHLMKYLELDGVWNIEERDKK